MPKKSSGSSRLPSGLVVVGGIAYFALVVVTCSVVLLPKAPVSLLITTQFGVAHAIAFPAASGVLGLFLASVVARVALKAKEATVARDRQGTRARFLNAALLGSVLLTVCSTALIVFPAPYSPHFGPPRAIQPGMERLIKVVSWNTGDRLGESDFANLIRNTNPDVIILPETSSSQLHYVIDRIPEYGGQVSVFTSESSGLIAPTSIVMNARLGEYSQIEGVATTFGAVSVAPVKGGNLPTIVGVHTAPPLPGLMDNWRKDLLAVAAYANNAPAPLILAGDFNATLRHGSMAAMSQVQDSYEALGEQRVGTWPSGLPSWLSAPIDHVFVDRSMRVIGVEVIDIGVSDHRPLVTTIGIAA